ncbi:MAG TPA: TetR family transcriptional regulator, partial [Anaerovoracaceae bacterium]|nr:TetR family transcriptional regulator [Anaerovoracaceae bacterium]
MINKKSTKEILGDSLIELMNSFDLTKISVQDIVNNCGLTRSTFYRYFLDKFDLVNWIYKTNADIPRIFYNKKYSWTQVSEKVLEFMYEHKNFFVNALNASGQNSF